MNYKTQDFVEETKKATGGKGANIIIDIVGGDYIDRNYDAAADGGRITQVSFMCQSESDRELRPPPPDGQASRA